MTNQRGKQESARGGASERGGPVGGRVGDGRGQRGSAV